MSGAAFEGLEGLRQQEAGPGYDAPAGRVEAGLAGVIIENAFSTHYPKARNGQDGLTMRAESLRTALESGHGTAFDPDILLDEVIAEVHRMDSLTDFEQTYWTSYLLDPLVQALYDMGHNCFLIDLAALGNQECLAIHLTGAIHDFAGNAAAPLTATYLTDSVTVFATDVRNCRLTLKGNASYAGASSSLSDLTLLASVGTCGIDAANCSFTLGAVEPVLKSAQNLRHCEVYVKDGVSLPDRVDLHLKGFYRNSNTLYVPARDGGWRRLRL